MRKLTGFGIAALLLVGAGTASAATDYTETAGAACGPQYSNNSAVMYSNYGQFYNNSGSTQDTTCPIAYTAYSSHYSYYLSSLTMYYYNAATLQSATCYISGTTTGGTANVSSTQSSNLGGYQTFVWSSPFGSTAVNYWGLSVLCSSFPATNSSIQGILSEYTH